MYIWIIQHRKSYGILTALLKLKNSFMSDVRMHSYGVVAKYTASFNLHKASINYDSKISKRSIGEVESRQARRRL